MNGWKTETGATVLEYALNISLIAMVGLAAIRALGDHTARKFCTKLVPTIDLIVMDTSTVYDSENQHCRRFNPDDEFADISPYW